MLQPMFIMCHEHSALHEFTLILALGWLAGRPTTCRIIYRGSSTVRLEQDIQANYI